MKNIKKTLSVISNEFGKNSEKSTLAPKSKTTSSVILSETKNPFKSILMKIKLLEENIQGRFLFTQEGQSFSVISNLSRNLFKLIFSIFSPKTKNQKLKTNFGFTLVELIVVITILAILGTISFISFNSYSSSARDSVRISDITNTKKALELFNIKAGSYPLPDNSITLSGGVNNTGSIIYQGILSDNVARNIGLSKVVVDPLTKNNYMYKLSRLCSKFS